MVSSEAAVVAPTVTVSTSVSDAPPESRVSDGVDEGAWVGNKEGVDEGMAVGLDDGLVEGDLDGSAVGAGNPDPVMPDTKNSIFSVDSSERIRIETPVGPNE